ncbi:MAG: thiamine-phosphate kinase [Chitinivibrionales bacterium]|nr:thiamine-phosphate kinase [Chitinivibrionales bacterium]
MTRPFNHPSREHRLLESLGPFLNYAPSQRYPAGIGDDAALRRCRRGERLVFTADTLVEGVHFSLAYMTLAEVGFKAMVANLSDCAAMGAGPDGALVQIVFPQKQRARAKRHVKELYSGIRKACRRWGFPVVGGNISMGPSWIVDVTLVGRLGAKQRALHRSGARPGDVLWVSGRPGESAAGLAAIRRWGRARAPGELQALIRRHVAPSARIRAGNALAADRNVRAVIDVSDGVSKDCLTLSYENDLTAELLLTEALASSAMRRAAAQLGADWQDWFLHGGEDYELLFAASPAFDPGRLRNQQGVRFRRIGRFTDRGFGAWVKTCDGSRARLSSGGWDHLGKK